MEIHAYTELDQALRELAPSRAEEEMLDQYDRELRQRERRWPPAIGIGFCLVVGPTLWALIAWALW